MELLDLSIGGILLLYGDGLRCEYGAYLKLRSLLVVEKEKKKKEKEKGGQSRVL